MQDTCRHLFFVKTSCVFKKIEARSCHAFQLTVTFAT